MNRQYWRMGAGFGVGGLLVVLAATAVVADGFRNPPEGAAALGRAGTRLTRTGDASAVTHNPANLLDLEQAEIMPSITIGLAEKTYTAPTGASEEMDAVSVMPSIYGVFPSAGGTFAFGLGISTPYGQSNEWEERGIFTGIQPYYSQVKSINVSPVMAVRLARNLTLGIGADVIWSELELRQTNPWSGIPGDNTGPAANITLKGDGMGLGAHAGLTWQISDRQRAALVYKSPISVDVEGDFDARNLPPGLPPIVTPNSYFTSTLEFPQMVAVGYGLQVSESLRVEANVEWLEHSVYDSATVDVGNNNVLLQPTPVMAPLEIEQDWDDTWTFSVGADWQLNEAWVLRCGYIYLPSPVPEETLSPSTAEADQHTFGLGIGFDGRRHAFDVAYAPTYSEDRDDAVGGEYEITSHLILASYMLQF